MPMLFASAELGRARARFGFLTVGAGLLVFVLLFQQALLDAVLKGMSGALTHQSGAVLVYNREAQHSFAGSLVTPQQLTDVSKAPGVAAAGELAVTLLSVRGPGSDERLNASVIGFRPGGPGTPLGLDNGRLPEAADEVVVSTEDAVGRYGVGDKITIEPGESQLTVVGLTRGGRLNVGPTLWTPWDTYVKLVQATTPDLPLVLPSVVAIEPAADVGAEALVRQLNETFPALEAMTREEAAATTPGLSSVQLAFSAVMGLGYLVVAVVIGFFFLTLTLQKEASVTLMRAVGARSGYLVRNLLYQVAVVTFGGLAIGSLLLLVATAFLGSTMAVQADPVVMAKTAVPALAVALLGAIPPVRRVLKTDPYAVVGRPSLGGVG
jgi:putative ABC transport system permease protein